MWIFLETSHFMLLGKYMNTISCKKWKSTQWNPRQSLSAMYIIHDWTNICYDIWEERKLDEYPSWRVMPYDIRYSLLLFFRIPISIYSPPSLKIFTYGNLWKYFFLTTRWLVATSNEVSKYLTREIIRPPMRTRCKSNPIPSIFWLLMASSNEAAITATSETIGQPTSKRKKIDKSFL